MVRLMNEDNGRFLFRKILAHTREYGQSSLDYRVISLNESPRPRRKLKKDPGSLRTISTRVAQ